MNMKVKCIVVDGTIYNGDRVRKYSHNDNNTTINNKNTNNISTTPNHSKVGIGVEVATESVVTNNSFPSLKTTPGRKK